MAWLARLVLSLGPGVPSTEPGNVAFPEEANPTPRGGPELEATHLLCGGSRFFPCNQFRKLRDNIFSLPHSGQIHTQVKVIILTISKCTAHGLKYILVPPIGFPSLWVCLLWTFQIPGITRYVVFCVWLLSFGTLFQGAPTFLHPSVTHSSFWPNPAWPRRVCFSVPLLMGLWGMTSFGCCQ